MGRGKVVMKRIEDNISRQVTFSKRRSGLMKKARELSVLCDVDVALIVFSGKGKLYEFGSANSLREILERYQIHLNAEDDASKGAHEAKKHQAEYAGLRTGADLLQMVQRHVQENNVEQLNMTELTQLEQRLDAILRQTNFRKTQLMMNAVTALHEKEKQLREEKQHMEEETQLMMNAVTANNRLMKRTKQLREEKQLIEEEIAAKINGDNERLHQHRVVELGINTLGYYSLPPLQQDMLRLL